MKNYEFNIFDVAQVLGLQPVGRQRGGTQEYVCPFCGSKSGSFAITSYKNGETRNLYRCLKTSCDAKGNMIQLYMNLTGVSDYKQAEKEIRDRIGTVTNTEFIYDQISQHDDVVECASDETLDKVYRTMYKHLQLLDRDKADLSRRGLSKEHFEIFRTVPLDKEERRRICRCIMREGLSLKGVPGFYKNRYGTWDINTYDKIDGYFCPEFSQDGLMYGFQIRLANPQKPDDKYRAFSSNGKSYGTSAGARNTWLWGEDRNMIVFTEGVLKATVIYRLLNGKVSVVGVPGVSQKGCIDLALRTLKEAGVKKIYLAFDMDRCMGTVCRRDYKEDACLLCDCGFESYQIKECPKKREKKKGLINCWSYVANKAIQVGFVPKESLISVSWGLKPNGVWDGVHKGFDDYLASLASVMRERNDGCVDLVKYLFKKEENRGDKM